MSVAHLRVWWGDEALPLLTELLDWELAYLHTGPCGAHSSHDGHSSDHGSGADGGSGDEDLAYAHPTSALRRLPQ